jgi:membrane fusion protein
MSATQQPLFRPQSLQARQNAWLGRPSVSSGLPTTFTTIMSVALITALAALVTFGNYARRIDLQGVILPNTGLIRISSPAAGWIQSIAVHDGQTVRQGALLYRVNVDTSTAGGGAQEQIISTLMALRPVLNREIDRDQALQTYQGAQLAQRADNLKQQLAQLEQEIVVQQGFVQQLNSEYTEFAGLLKKGMAAIDDVSAREQAWMHALTSLEELKTNRTRLQAELIEAKYQLDTHDLQTGNEIDALRTKLAEIKQQIATSEAHRSIDIRAPGDGVVTAVMALPGQVIGVGAALLTIVPTDSTMQAELLAPSSAIGFVRPGEHVLLRYAAFPYQKFGQHGGKIVDVSHAALRPEELSELQASEIHPGAGPYFRITVRPDQQQIDVYGNPEPLVASMQVQAFVLLDRRPLYQWILEPLYGMRRAVHSS